MYNICVLGYREGRGLEVTLEVFICLVTVHYENTFRQKLINC